MALTGDRALEDDGGQDIASYNKELVDLGSPKWFEMPWLYAECYLYRYDRTNYLQTGTSLLTSTARRMHTFFALSNHWKSYDIFARQKLSTFRSSRPAVIELAAKYKALISQLNLDKHPSDDPKEREEAERILYMEMCEICLWGNATDLSLLTSLTYDDIQKLQGADARKKAEKNILVNDLPAAYGVLKGAQKEGKRDRQVDIVLDNAGFELFVDLILAGYLLAAGLATQIILHPKSIPWFVSDVLPADFASLLGALADPQAFYTLSDDGHATTKAQPLSGNELSDLSFLFSNLQSVYAEGQLIIRPNDFWTSAHTYWSLPQATRLYEDLKESELVIFKGDLNYRKLTADAMWEPTTPFSTAIGSMGPGSGIRTLALRTCKADVVVGLPEGEDERLKFAEGGRGDSGSRKWAWSGKWAVVQFCNGKA